MVDKTTSLCGFNIGLSPFDEHFRVMTTLPRGQIGKWNTKSGWGRREALGLPGSVASMLNCFKISVLSYRLRKQLHQNA